MEPQTIPEETVIVQSSVHYAGFWIRYAAVVIDGFIIGTGSLILIALGFILAGKDGATVGRILSFLGGWFYSIMMINSSGATIGKRAVGIEVTAVDGTKLALGQIIIRETIGKILSGIILMIGYIMAAFTGKKQALHDKLISSVVVYKDPSKKNAVVWVVAGILSFLVIMAGIGIVVSLIISGITASRGHVDALKQSDSDTIKAAVFTAMSHSVVYYSDHKDSLTGFSISASSTESGVLPACSSLIANVSKDGQALAVFARECAIPDTYFCASLNFTTKGFMKGLDVPAGKALSGATSCN